MADQRRAAARADARTILYEAYVSRFKRPARANAPAPSFVWWDHKYLPLLNDLDRAAPILELGCGDGSLLAYLGRRGFSHARGIDISAEQVVLARAHGVQAEQADIFDVLSSRPGQHAAIIAVDVLEHFTREELVRLLPLVHAALAPGGRLLVQTANGAALCPGQVIYGDLTHHTIFTQESLAQLLRASDFSTFRFYETGPVPIRLRGRLDFALWQALKLLANTVRQIETGKRQAIWTENLICLARV